MTTPRSLAGAARAIGLRPGEFVRVALTFSLLFLVVAAYLLIKAVRNALFISQYGALKLPYAMLGVAIAAGLCSALYLRVARRRGAGRVASGLYLFFAVNLVAFWLLAVRGYSWLYVVLYLWAGVYGVLSTTQVWSLANEVFTTREAKRLFGYVGAGGILGAIWGGSLARLAKPLGTEQLLLVVAAMMLVAAVVARAVARHRLVGDDVPSESDLGSGLAANLRVIAASPHLRGIAALVVLTALATTSVDFQFNLVAESAIQERDALTQFFGSVYSTMSVLGFAVQVLLTGALLRQIGLGGALLFLPASVLAGTAAVLAIPSLWAGAILKGSDGVLKHSLDRASRELLYLPVRPSIRARAKLTIDTALDRLGDGLAGTLQILLTAVLGFGLRGSLIANTAIVALWIAVAVRVRRSYIAELGGSLGRGDRAAAGAPLLADDADTRRVLAGTLESDSERVRLAALELAAEQSGSVPEARLTELAQHDPSRRVRAAALGMLLGGAAEGLPAGLVASLEGEDRDVLTAMLDVVGSDDPEARRAMLARIAGDGEAAIPPAAVALLLRKLGVDFAPLAHRMLETLSSAEAPSGARRIAAEILGLLPQDSPTREHLAALLSDPDPTVAAAAAESAGRLGLVELVPEIAARLGRGRTRAAANRALLRLGPAAAPPLAALLENVAVDRDVRARIPDVLTRLGTASSARAIGRAVADPAPDVRDAAIAALCRFRRRDPHFRPLDPRTVEREMVEAVREWIDLRRAADTLRHPGPGRAEAAERCLLETLDARERDSAQRVFRLLGLAHPPGDMERARSAVLQGTAVERANALELLDNLVPRAVRRDLLGLLESQAAQAAGHPSESDRREARAAALRDLADRDDPWVVACAVHLMRVERLTFDGAWAGALTQSSDPAVREEATRLVASSRESSQA